MSTKSTKSPERIAEVYLLSPEALAYVPSIQEIAASERSLSFEAGASGPFGRGPERTQVQIDAAIADGIEQSEKRLIRLQYLQRVRVERAGDKSWLKRVLGL